MPEVSEHSRISPSGRQDREREREPMDIDQAIEQVEKLYRAVTGREPPPVGDTPYAPIPPEKDPQRYVEEQLDRLTGLLSGFPMPGMGSQAWVPTLSVWESAHEFLYCVDLPGVQRDSVQVALEGNALVVSGERRPPMGNGSGPFEPRWLERQVGQFRRAILLPQGATPERIQAQIRDGVLEIRAPRSMHQPSTRSIPVN